MHSISMTLDAPKTRATFECKFRNLNAKDEVCAYYILAYGSAAASGFKRQCMRQARPPAALRAVHNQNIPERSEKESI